MTYFNMPPSSSSFEARGGWACRNLVSEFDLTLEQAAGIVGNIGYESGGFKKLQEIKPLVAGSKGGYGWAQWTATRRVTFELYCKNQGLSPSSDQANYGFLVVELHGSHKSTITALKRCTTLEQAVFSVGRTYETPAGTTETYLPGLDDRLIWAKRALVGARAAQAVPASQSTLPLLVSDDPVKIGIAVLQGRLKDAGFDPGVIDGIWGPNTARAIQDYHRSLTA